MDQTTMNENAKPVNVLAYFLKKVKDNNNEIVVLRQQKDQFSAIYIKGDIEINYVNSHLNTIRSALSRLGASNQTNIFPYDYQFAFSMPSFDNFMIPDFDTDAFNLNPTCRLCEQNHHIYSVI